MAVRNPVLAGLGWGLKRNVMNASARPDVSVIMTVLNEGHSLPALLPSLMAQTCVPAEIVVCDGGSTDDTVPQLERWQQTRKGEKPVIRIISRPGANISEGRNAAIQAAQHDLIAVTDAGICLEKTWLEELVRVMEAHRADPDVKGVAGFFLPAPCGVFETALAGTTLPFRKDVDADRFLPAGRSMLFQRTAWQAVGGFPEWLDYCEDLVFDQQVEHLAGGRRKAMPLAHLSVVRVRPRTSFRSFFRQYCLYARGDGKAALWGKRHLVRYSTYLGLIPGLARLMLGARPRGRQFGRWLAILGFLLYCRRPFERVWKLGRHRLSPWELAMALGLVPAIRLVGDIAKMLGYPMGWLWRIRHWRRAEIHWRTGMRIRAECRGPSTPEE